MAIRRVRWDQEYMNTVYQLKPRDYNKFNRWKLNSQIANKETELKLQPLKMKLGQEREKNHYTKVHAFAN